MAEQIAIGLNSDITQMRTDPDFGLALFGKLKGGFHGGKAGRELQHETVTRRVEDTATVARGDFRNQDSQGRYFSSCLGLIGFRARRIASDVDGDDRCKFPGQCVVGHCAWQQLERCMLHSHGSECQAVPVSSVETCGRSTCPAAWMMIKARRLTVASGRSAAAVPESALQAAAGPDRQVPLRRPVLPQDQSAQRRQPELPLDQSAWHHRSVLPPDLPALRPGQSSLPHRPARQQACSCS
jgi:hypothetical protein